MKKPSKSPPATPSHLDAEAALLRDKFRSGYGIVDTKGLALVDVLVGNDMLARKCQTRIEKDGLLTSAGRAHPLLNVQRDARNGFLAAIRALNLEDEPSGSRGGQIHNTNSNANMKRVK